MLAIKTSKLIDGMGRVLEDMVVLVEGERISELGKAGEVEIPEGTEVIDATDKTVMPGLIDSHVHLGLTSGDPKEYDLLIRRNADISLGTVAFMSYAHAMMHLEAGVTSVRDDGCRAYIDVALRDAINKGLLEGPRMKVCGHHLASTGMRFDPVKGLVPEVNIPAWSYRVDSPDEGRKAVRYQIRMGVDFIQTSAGSSQYLRRRAGWSQELTYDTMRAICEVAHWSGRKVSATCYGDEGVKDAILAGVDGLEHGRFLSDEIFEMMAEHGIYLDPTLSPEARVMEHGQKELGVDDEQWNWTLKLYDAMYDSVARAHKIGVKIAAGSDPYMPYVRHGELGYELEQLVKAGLTPMEAIVAATKIGAEVLDMAEEIGTVEEGKLADLVVVDGDPLGDIKVLQDRTKIKKVIKGGKVVVDRV